MFDIYVISLRTKKYNSSRKKIVLLKKFYSEMTNDSQLLQMTIEGDHAAFHTLSERYGQALYVFAVRIMGDGFMAEDIVQDAFEALWNNRTKLYADTSVRNYLYGIVRNRCLAAIRQSKVRELADRSVELDDEDIMSRYIETETTRLLIEAIETLPPRSAEVIRLSCEGMRQEQIAETMGISIATVKALKIRAISKLRKILPIVLIDILLDICNN
jgi:RNA polymerase sigma-70 factor (ECF subfamily)